MKKMLLLFLLLAGFANRSFAQTAFTIDSVWAPPYICQATEFDVEIFGQVSSSSTQYGSQSFSVSNDTVYVQFHFTPGTGPATPYPLYRKLNVPAPPIGRYKVIVQGFYNGQLQQTVNATLSVCSSISGTKDDDTESLKLKLYPNPVQNYLLAELPVSNVSGSITLTDLSGRTLFTKKTQPNQRTVTLNMKHFATGLYLLNYRSEKTAITRKFLKR